MTEAHGPAVAAALHRFPRERTWLLPALHAVQAVCGHLPDWALARVGAALRVPLSEVHGVATGYPEFRLTPRGRHHVRVCAGVSCALAGGGALLAAVERGFGLAAGQGGEGSELTLEAADCFFACSMAPLVEVDDRLHGRVSPEDVRDLSRWFSAEPGGHAPAPDGGEDAAATPGGPGAGPARPAGPAPPGQTLGRLVSRAGERARGRPPLRLAAQVGTCGESVGGAALLAALRRAAAGSGLAVEVIEGACAGACHAAPSVEIHHPEWPRALLERVDAARAPALLRTLGDGTASLADAGFSGVAWADAPWRGLRPAGGDPFWAAQERVLLHRAGRVDPSDLDDALRHGAYAALARALEAPPEALIETVKASRLEGRGGAFFPTGVKWEACRRAGGEERYVVVNGEEGEPGIFKDRHLMEADPHQVLEGALLAAYAAGARRVILYVHGEAHLSARRLARAAAEARQAGILGDRVLGAAVACDVELRRGAGGFVLGEETALLESIEGRRAQPRTRPPFPVESGLWGRPTVINNVETLAAIPAIVSRGAEWFAALGTPRAAGTKVFGLSGPIRRPGVVEARTGVTLSTLVETMGGGLVDGGACLGAVVGGPSGTVVPAALFGTAMEPRGEASPGTGGVVAVPAGASVQEIVKTLLAFNARESCGKCTPCREGTPRLLALVDRLDEGPDAAGEARLLAEAIQLGSLCGLGQAAPLALLRARADVAR